MKKHPLCNQVSSSSAYRKNIYNLHKKYHEEGRLYAEDDAGIKLSDAYFSQGALIKALRKDILAEKFKFHALKPHQIQIAEKKRTIFIPPTVDKILQAVFYDYYTEKLAERISPAVYSYQKGKCATDAIRALSFYLKWQYDNNDQHPDLYLFHTDITQYTDSIPVHDRSPLWPMLKTMSVEEGCEPLPPYLWNLLVEMVRPILITREGNYYQNCRGIPTGTMMTTVIANLYLKTIDKYLQSIPGAFYARFGDDIIFIHPSHTIFSKVINTLYRMTTKLGLVLSSTKTEYIYLTSGAIKHPQNIPFSNYNQITFLGYTVKANGDISFPQKKLKKLLKMFDERINNVLRFSSDMSLDEKGSLIVASVNRLIEWKSNMRVPAMERFYKVLTDRAQLRQIDYLLRLKIATALSGVKGPKAFRIISPQQICVKWGLHSLERLINNSRH